ncbi:MAG TPA: hypothetical protein VNS02_03485 [Rhizobiaceae bacterium]|nr:hypothetical protein [Rhizobiaceae bacterium]
MTEPPPDTASGFFVSRWRGAVSVERILFVDMLLVGTAINLAATFASLMALGFKFPLWVSIAVYALPIPYNIFLTLCLWRATAAQPAAIAAAWRLSGLGWLAIASLL